MKFNSKLTWGLAWTGLAVVLAVPSADFLTGKMGGGPTAAVITSTTDPVTGKASKPVKTASVTTTLTKNGVTITPKGTAPTTTAAATTDSNSTDPVTKLLKSGKPLPDYISGGTSPAATTEPTQVAAVDPTAIVAPPMPFPSWARPHDTARPVATKSTEPALVVDETQIDTQAAIDQQDSDPLPPAGLPTDPKTKRLDRYLESQGLLNDSAGGKSSATITVTERRSGNYDPNGFFLSDGPNNADARRAARRARIEQMFGSDAEDDSGDDGPFSFNLF